MQSIPSFRVSCASLVLTSVMAASTVGCVRAPKTGAEATGEPLNVEVRTETRTYTTQAKVGEVVNRDSSGRVVGTSEVYENRTGSYDVTRWQVFQGDTPIDDQDFFRIGGDMASAKEIADGRASGVTMNRVGVGLLIGGGAAALAGAILSSTMSSDTASPSKVPGILLTGGLITVSVGGILTWIGIAKVKREHPIDDPARANAVAKKYNQSLGGSSDEEPAPKPKKKKKKKKVVEEEDE